MDEWREEGGKQSTRRKGERLRRDWKEKEGEREKDRREVGTGVDALGSPYLLLCRGWDSRKGTMGVCFGGRLRD